jgi:nucleoside-diphosphate-sugar epimerase
MMTLAITGASGFIGRHVVDACRTAGDVRVRVLSRRAPVWADDGVAHYVGDLTDPKNIDAFLAGADCVIHLAYLRGGRNANVNAASNLVVSAATSGVRRIVHCSTAVVVGNDAPSPVSEDTPARPRGEYQETKFAIEETLQKAADGRVELAILRPTEVFGLGGEGMREVIERVRSGPPWKAVAYRMLLGARRLNYVCVRNVVAALLTLSEARLPGNGEVFIVSDDDDPANTYATVDAMIRRALGRGTSALSGVVLPRAVIAAGFRWMLRDHAPPDRVFDASKIRALGYAPATTLSLAIPELVTFEHARVVGRG